MSLDSLLVYKSKYIKKRIGSDKDGGYVIADGLTYDLLLSCGVGDDISFEKEFLKSHPKLECYAFDGTIDSPPEYIERMQFIRKNIGPLETETTTNLHTLINNYTNIFLKIDIESYEFRWLHTLTTEQLIKFKQIVIEYHFPFSPASFSHFDIPLPVEDKMAIIDKLYSTHSIIHLHGNNCCGTTLYNNIKVPNIFECTYLRKDEQDFIELNEDLIPSALDRPNINGPDIVLKGFPFSKDPEVIHTYLQKTSVNGKIGGQPPGFADYLRGSMALYQYSKKYNYKLKFDIKCHPIFKYLSIPQDLITTTYHSSTFELLPPYSYQEMPCILDTIFGSGASFSILTNCFYNETNNLLDTYNFIKSFLIPSDIIKDSIAKIKQELDINFNEPYTIVHARLGDRYLVDKNLVNTEEIIKIRAEINRIKNSNRQVLFIADSKEIKEHVKDICNITSAEPIHTGSLDTSDIDKKLITTLSEFFIMAESSEIYCINYWDGSGFSRICSKIFSIPYYNIKL